MSENVLPIFFLGFLWCHFEFIFAYGVKEVWGSDLTSLIYMQLSSFPNTTCWRNCLSSLIVLPPLSKIDHRCVDLFLGCYPCLFVFIHVYFCYPCLPYHFDYWSFPLLSWANCRRWWGTGRPGMLQSVGLQRAGHNLVMNSYYSLTSRRVMLPALFFSLKTALAIPSLSWFHINFRILCSVGNLTGIILNL